MSFFKVLGLILILIIGLGFSGCSSAMPNAVNGKYYMLGDSNCKTYKIIDNHRVMCYNSDGKKMGYRNAMNDEELQKWQSNKSQNNVRSKNTLNQRDWY